MKPILFNTEMVRAILEGRKTVTRRVVKLPSYIQPQDNGMYTLYADGTCYENERLVNILQYLKAPYQVNDILYVRETWHKYIKRVGKGETCRLQEFYGYRASIANSEDAREPWKPSIHMPKEAARLFLRVTDVRVERLQDITNEQILAEGADKKQIDDYIGKFPDPQDEWIRECYIFEWSYLWDKTIKKDQYHNYSWSANPYVWVIEFEVVDGK